MTTEEIREAYPNSWGIIVAFERNSLCEAGFQSARDHGISPARFRDDTRKSFLKRHTTLIEEGLAQIDHPDFLRYCAAKLGAF